MKFNIKRHLSYLMVILILLSSVLTGCTKSSTGGSQTSAPTSSVPASSAPTSSAPPSAPTISGNGKITDKPVTLKVWMPANADMLVTARSLNETPFAKGLEERTGVKVNYIHPAAGQEKEQFGLLAASGDLPDIIMWNWTAYPGGAQKAIDDKIIISLNDLFKKGYAPNLSKMFAQSPIYDKLSKMDNGTYFSFSMMTDDDPLLNAYQGLAIRQDWVDDLGLKNPTTVDEWDSVLKAFKNIKGVTFPLTFQLGMLKGATSFAGAYGVTMDFFQDNGKIKYGPMEPGYKDYLTLLKKWYDGGILDPDFPTQDRKAIDAKITGGKSGAFIGTNDSWIGTYLKLMTVENPKVNIRAVQAPVMNKGDKIKIRFQDFPVKVTANAGAITPACKEKEIACRWLDWMYGDDGLLYTNMGTPGESYNMVNGEPKYTEYITKNKDGLTMKQTLARYTTCVLGYFPGVQKKYALWQQRLFPQQNEALEIWKTGGDEAITWRVPALMPTADESSKMAIIMNEITTYNDEMFLKFITGKEPISNFDAFVAKLKSLKIEEAIKLKQAALDRFNKR